ncbi:MAG: hypothetical protein J5I98_13890 [Phaeodactylibacter sp.]|nr:hypothetical protein [Phaeodactylibacter sp.]
MEIKHREPARTLRELYNNLNPLEFLTKENRHFYVNVYGDIIAEIRKDLLWSDEPRQTVYLTGQSGSGKTTALNFLSNDDIEAEFVVKRFDGNKLLDFTDVSVIDLFLMLAFELVEGNADLERIYLKRLSQIKGLHEGSLAVETVSEQKETDEKGQGVKAGLGLKFLEFIDTGIDFFYNYRNSREQRDITRRVFAFKKHELRDLVNEVIERYEETHGGNKRLLLIFNELDHIKDWPTINELFLGGDRYLLEGLKCKKIISLPVILKIKPFKDKMIYFLGLKLSSNPNHPEQDLKKEVEEHKEMLRRVIHARVAPEPELIQPKALEYAIQQSGGIIRQLVNILRYAILRAGNEAEKISLNDVENGAEAFRPVLRDSLVTPDTILLLEKFRTTHFFMSDHQSDNALLTDLFLANQVILYENGDPWCDVNPLIREVVATYAKRIKQDDGY